jgi:hypothetical protein
LVSAEVTAFCVSWAVAGIDAAEYWDRIKTLQADSVQAWEPVLGKSWKRSGYASPKDYLAQGWKELLFEFDKIPLAMAKDSSDICDILGGGWGSDKHWPARLPAFFGFQTTMLRQSSEVRTQVAIPIRLLPSPGPSAAPTWVTMQCPKTGASASKTASS